MIPDLGAVWPQLEAWTDNSHLETPRIEGEFSGAWWPAMSRARAMRVPAVSRARHLTAGTLAPLPLVALRINAPVDPQPYWCQGTDGQLGDVTRDQARAWGLTVQSPWSRMLWTVDDHLFHGESLWFATAVLADKRPARLARVPFDHWEVSDAGEVVDLDGKPFPPDRVVYIPGPHEGILNYAGPTIAQAAALESVAGDVARHPIRFELHQTTETELTPEEKRELISEARAALNRNDGILFTNAAIETKEHRLDAANDLVIAGRNASALDVARHVSMPGAMIDATTTGASLEYQTTATRNQQWIDYGLSLYVAAIDARLSMDDIVPAGQRVALDQAALTTLTPPPTGAPTED